MYKKTKWIGDNSMFTDHKDNKQIVAELINRNKPTYIRNREKKHRDRIANVLNRNIRPKSRSYKENQLYKKYLNLWEQTNEKLSSVNEEKIDSSQLYLSILNDISEFKNQNNIDTDTELNNNNVIKTLKDIFNQVQQRTYQNFTLKRATQQAKLFTREVMSKMSQVFVTEKTDGYHSLWIVVKDINETHHVFMYYKNDLIKLSNSPFIMNNTFILKNNMMIIEGEFVEHKNTFHAFDFILGFNFNRVYKQSFKNRLQQLKDNIRLFSSIDVPTEYTLKTFILLNMNQSTQPVLPSRNDAWVDSDYKDVLSILGVETLNFEGLMIYPNDNTEYSRTTIFKWKPIKHQTIDFLAKRLNNDDENVYTYILFSTGTKREFTGVDNRFFEISNFNDDVIPVRFNIWDTDSKTNKYGIFKTKHDDLDNKIVELRLVNHMGNYIPPLGEIPKWEFVQVREDRQQLLDSRTYFGNFYTVAQSIWNYYQNPITVSEILTNMSLIDGNEDLKYTEDDEKKNTLLFKIHSQMLKRYVVDMINKKQCYQCKEEIGVPFKTYVKNGNDFKRLIFCSLECMDECDKFD